MEAALKIKMACPERRDRPADGCVQRASRTAARRSFSKLLETSAGVSPFNPPMTQSCFLMIDDARRDFPLHAGEAYASGGPPLQ